MGGCSTRARAVMVRVPAPDWDSRLPAGSSRPIRDRSCASTWNAGPAFACICRSADPTRRTDTRRTVTSRTSDGPPPTKILVVEDDPNIVDLIRSNLAVRGFETLVSTDGERVLQMLETEAPDLILLDLMLPVVDGFELCKQVRERSRVGVIVVSARGGCHDKA